VKFVFIFIFLPFFFFAFPSPILLFFSCFLMSNPNRKGSDNDPFIPIDYLITTQLKCLHTEILPQLAFYL
jgi:hypothetical protein